MISRLTPLLKTDILSRSFLTARLLTGNIAQAETAVMEAISLCNPEQENAEEFYRITLRAALQMHMIAAAAESHEECCTDSQLPIELRRVLELSPELRRSFVLRILAGLPAHVCAQILHLEIRQLNQYCREAMRTLTALDSPQTFSMAASFSRNAPEEQRLD